MTTVGDEVRRLRKSRGWSRQGLADRPDGVTAQTVWLLETHEPDDAKLSTLSGIADALGVPRSPISWASP